MVCRPPEALVSEHEQANSTGDRATGIDFVGTKRDKYKKKAFAAHRTGLHPRRLFVIGMLQGKRPDMKMSVKSRDWIKKKKEKQANDAASLSAKLSNVLNDRCGEGRTKSHWIPSLLVAKGAS